MTNTIGYIRTSTRVQEQSIEVQKKLIKDYCNMKEWTLTQSFVDEGWSGAKLDRPAFKKMLTYIDENKIDVVVFTKLDRLARSLQDLLNLAEDFKAKGIQFVSINDSIDTSTAQGRLAFQVMGAFTEFERSIIRERLEAGIKRAREKGVKFGRPYTKLPKEHIIDLYKKGVSVSFLARQYRVSRGNIYNSFKRWGLKVERTITVAKE